MRKKLVLLIVAVVCLLASLILFYVAVNYETWQYLKYFFWIPIPVALFALLESKRLDP